MCTGGAQLTSDRLLYLNPYSKVFGKHCSSDSQDIPLIVQILRNRMIQHGVHNSLPLVCVPGQMNSVHILPPYFFKIHFSIILQSMTSSYKVFPSGFIPQTLYVFLFSICTTHPSHLFFPKFDHPKNIQRGVKSCSSSFCSFLCPATSSHSDPNMNLPQHCVLKHLQPAFFLLCTTGIFILQITALSMFTS